jgi:hypothetical protein
MNRKEKVYSAKIEYSSDGPPEWQFHKRLSEGIRNGIRIQWFREDKEWKSDTACEIYLRKWRDIFSDLHVIIFMQIHAKSNIAKLILTLIIGHIWMEIVGVEQFNYYLWLIIKKKKLCFVNCWIFQNWTESNLFNNMIFLFEIFEVSGGK